MGQVTIYLDSETEKKMNTIIKKTGVSRSKWISDLIKQKITTTWPENIVKLAGAWTDLTTAEDIRKNMAEDADRESI
jgi:metal-responsive CopG/Arc/MetJ family transcriptional regulator